MTMELELHRNSEVHLVPWQSLLMGHKSSHPSPELPVSPLALIHHEPQLLHTYRPSYRLTRNESDHTRSDTAPPAVHILHQQGWVQDKKHNTVHQYSNKSTRTNIVHKTEVASQTLKRQTSQKKTTQSTREVKKNLTPGTQGQQSQMLSITITCFNPNSLTLWHTRTLPPHNPSKL